MATVAPLMTSSSFNSRTREGCDAVDNDKNHIYYVSIHAPGRGATATLLSTPTRWASFNSRTREGCDACLQRQAPSEQFQFTHPGGVRLIETETATTGSKFQFTHPGGVRLHECPWR